MNITPTWALPALLLTACFTPNQPFAPTLVADPAVVNLGTVTYEDPLPVESILMTNTGGTVMYISSPGASSDTAPEAAELVDMDDVALMPIYPGQSEFIEVSLVPNRWTWFTVEDAVVDLPFEFRYHFNGQSSDAAEPTSNREPSIEWVFQTAQVTYSIDCDLDDDGFDAEICGGDDCNDDDDGIHPDAAESCDGVDENCDGMRDNGAADATDWYPDEDLDGFGDDSVDPITTCFSPAGGNYTDRAGDCDDEDDDRNEGKVELCNDGIDNDCDGETDLADGDCDD